MLAKELFTEDLLDIDMMPIISFCIIRIIDKCSTVERCTNVNRGGQGGALGALPPPGHFQRGARGGKKYEC